MPPSGRDRLCVAGQLGVAHHRVRQSRLHCQGDSPVLHGPYLTGTRTVGGKTVTRKISEDQQTRCQAWFDNPRKLHQLVTDLEALSLRAFEQTGRSSPVSADHTPSVRSGPYPPACAESPASRPESAG